MNVIQVRIDKIYGNIVLYPICEKAKLFCKLAKTKTITQDMERHIRSLGFDIVEQLMVRG